MPVNSHKQISKFLLKRFSHESLVKNTNPKTGVEFQNRMDVVWVLDIKKKEIEEVPIQDVNIEFGYFGEHIEQLLSTKESAFSQLLTALDKWERAVRLGQNETFEFGKYEEMLNEFLKLSLVRADNMLDTVKEGSVYGGLIKGTAFYDEIFSRDKLVEIMLDKPILKEAMEKFRVNLMLNISDKNFITSKGCWYSAYESNTDQQIIFPIDAKKAIIWYDKKFDYRYALADGTIGTQCIKDGKGVENLNTCCLRSQLHGDCDFLVAKEKHELEQLLPKIETLS